MKKVLNSLGFLGLCAALVVLSAPASFSTPSYVPGSKYIPYTAGDGVGNPGSVAAQLDAVGAGGITQLTGDVTAGPGSGSQAATLAASGVTAATYGDATHVTQVTFDAKGRATGASNIALPAAGITQLTGDGTAGPGGGSQVFTLATTGVSAATYGDSLHVGQFTVNAKGLVTAAANVAAIAPAKTVVTNTANSTYTIDVTGGVTDGLILHNKSGAVSYVMPAPTTGRYIEVYDVTGAVNTLANNVFFVPHAGEKFNASAGYTLTGGATFNFTATSGTVTATGSQFQEELAVGMSIQSSNQAGVNYIISAIASDTSLTITPVFSGTTTATATSTRTSLTFAANMGKLSFNSNGTDWYVTGDGTPTILRYTASSGAGTGVAPFIPPQGVTVGTFRGAGGGGGGASGGGGGATNTGGGGGGASIQAYDEVAFTPLSNNAVTIGAGGSGGAASGTIGNPGNVGGDTSVGSLVTFGGASGGSASSVSTNDSAGGLCIKGASGTNLWNVPVTSTVVSSATTFFMSIAGGGGAHTVTVGVGGARNIVGGFAGGTGGAAGAGGGGGGGAAGPRGAGGNGSAGSSGVTTQGGDAAANSGAGGGGSGGSTTTTAARGGNGGSGYVDIIYVL